MQKILIIDDISLMRTQIENILYKNGINKIEGISSDINLYGRIKMLLTNISLIIMDVNLKSINSIELAKQINSDPNSKSIPIIFLSSSDDYGTVMSAIKAGAVDYIVKPFNEDIFVKKVLKALGKPMRKKKDNLYITIEKAKEIISIEYERAVRGRLPVSFISIIVEEKFLEKAVIEIQSILRKIDMVFIIKKQIFILLPMTAEENINVVRNNINNKIDQTIMSLQEKNAVCFYPEAEKSFEELIKELDI